MIEIPYRALALNLTTAFPGASTALQYFPIRRAANST